MYLTKRFSFFEMIPFVFVLSISVVSFAQIISTISALRWQVISFELLIVMIGCYLFFLRSKIWNEFKYKSEKNKEDSHQSISPLRYSELSKIVWITFGLEFLLMVVFAQTWWAFALLAGYSILLRYDSGLSQWLKCHPIINILRNSLLAIPLSLYLYSLTFFSAYWINSHISQWPWSITLHILVIFLGLCCIQMAVKFKNISEDTVTYSKKMLLPLQMFATVFFGVLFTLTNFYLPFLLIAVPLLLYMLFIIAKFKKLPNQKTGILIFMSTNCYLAVTLLTTCLIWSIA